MSAIRGIPNISSAFNCNGSASSTTIRSQWVNTAHRLVVKEEPWLKIGIPETVLENHGKFLNNPNVARTNSNNSLCLMVCVISDQSCPRTERTTTAPLMPSDFGWCTAHFATVICTIIHRHYYYYYHY